ncbi:helix-turn-helix domain-containing protein [Roseibium sp. SCP14]|uniref:helix-turn-helix domain-containing protein n=1 Tax=Roseibium sp. SCP14 TaxID=3141375 RepID=UPI0033376BD0
MHVDVAGRSYLPYAHFTVADAAPGERFSLWRESISAVFEVEAERELRRAREFDASLAAYLHGAHMLATTSAARQNWQRSERLIGHDGMDHYMIQLYETGNMLYSHRGEDRTVRAGDLIVFDNSQPMASKTTDIVTLTLIVPRMDLAPLLKAPDDQHLRRIGMGEPLAVLLRNHLLTLRDLSPRMRRCEAVSLNPSSLALIAACLNTGQPDDETQGGVQVARAIAVRRFISANLVNPELGPNFIMRSLGISRSRLYALFESDGGVAAYVRNQRLRLIKLRLADPSHDRFSIQQLMFEAGFASSASFSRLFRQQFGMSASEFRQEGRNFKIAASTGERAGRRWENWIRYLSE